MTRNVVLVLMDQLRYDVLSGHGGAAATPHLDAIAASGVDFHRAYTPTGLCSPARTSLFTGRYPHNHGVMNNVSGRDAINPDVLPDVPMLPALLADAGWRTGTVGKYHMAAHEAPKRNGFTDAIAPSTFWAEADFLGWRMARGYPVTADAPAFPIDGSTRYRPLTPDGAKLVQQFPTPVYGRESVPLEVTTPAYLMDRAIGLLDEYLAGPDPFFLTLSFLGPHWPHCVPEPFWSMYPVDQVQPWPSLADDFAGKTGAHRKMAFQNGVDTFTWEDWAPAIASYLGSVSFHDELVGRFVAAVDERTGGDVLLVVTTDHGDMTGSHGQFNKGPLMYEDVYRIPFMVRGPGIEPGTREEFVSTLDLTPTLLTAAGVDVPHGTDGGDLGPILRGATPADWRDAWFAEYHGDEQGLYSQRMLHTGRYKLVYNARDVDELYDLETDPWEMRNLVSDPAYADLYRRLQAQLYTWFVATRDPLTEGVRNFLP